MTDRLTPERRSENMRKIRGRDTSPEMIVRRIVHGMGFRYRLHVARLPGKPDLVFPRLKKVVEVRGCFWHQHDGCSRSRVPTSRVDYWLPKLRGNAARDRLNEERLRAAGWEVCALWECELRDMARTRERLRAFLNGESRAKKASA